MTGSSPSAEPAEPTSEPAEPAAGAACSTSQLHPGDPNLKGESLHGEVF